MQTIPSVLYRGSVKNVRGEVSAPNLLFEFSDRYSVFDWGEMPDQLDGKGKTLAIMGKSFFEYLGLALNWENLFSSEILRHHFDAFYLSRLERSEQYQKMKTTGLSHHYLGGEEWDSPYMNVKNISILRPLVEGDHYDYSAYKKRPVNALVPLEVIFRLGLAPGNSLSKRLGDDSSKWNEFGFEEVPSVGLLKKPVLDFSTKLERGDRYLDYKEAQSIADLTEAEWSELQTFTHLIALNLFHFHAQLGLELWDGKIEVAFTEGVDGERSFMLVDSIGIDELRLLHQGKSFSKEFLRETYKSSEWYKNLEAAKRDALVTGADFKNLCIEKYNSTPDQLSPVVKERAEAVYKSYANAVTSMISGKICFPEEYNLNNYSKRYL